MSSILTIAHLTLYDARRRKILAAAALCAAVFLAVFTTAIALATRELIERPAPFIERQATFAVFSILGLYAANFLSVLLAALLPVDALSGEIDSGVMQTLASKPIDRAQIVLGKWAGHLLLALAYLLLLCAGILIVIRAVSGLAPAGAAVALPLLMLEITLSLTVSVAGGARFSTVTNAIVAVGIYGVSFIGGFVEQIGGFAGIASMRTIGVLVSLVSPADSMWRLAAHYMEPEVMRSTGMLALGAAVPTAPMVWWAAGYTALTLLYGVAAFRRRAL